MQPFENPTPTKKPEKRLKSASNAEFEPIPIGGYSDKAEFIAWARELGKAIKQCPTMYADGTEPHYTAKPKP